VDRDDCALAENPQAEEAATCVELLAYRFRVLAAAWQELCAELQVDPEHLLRGMAGYDTVCQLERLGEFTQADRPEKGKSRTVERPDESDRVAQEADAMRQFLKERTRSSR
jgi:hypothetical protein